MPGTNPNRPGDLSRRRDANRNGNKWVQGTMRPTTLADVEIPENWHPVCKMIWESLHNTGMADFYQDTDWAYAYAILDEFSVYREPAPMREKGPDGKWQDVIDEETGEVQYHKTHKPSGQMFQTLMTALKDLGMTEGQRRSFRVELEKPKEDDTNTARTVSTLDEYRKKLGLA